MVDISISIMLVILYVHDTIEEDRHWLSNAPLDRIGALNMITIADT